MNKRADMEESDYMKLAHSIPATWYTSQESVEITKSIFYDIMMATAMRSGLVISSNDDMQQLLEILAKERDIPVEEAVMNIQNVAMTVGAVRLFTEKYPKIAEKFPMDNLGNPQYPAKFLAKILEITEEIAIDLLGGVLQEFATYLQPVKNQ